MRFLIAVALSLLLVAPGLAQKKPTSTELLTEALLLLNQVDGTSEDDEKRDLLEQALERLQRLVSEYPDDPISHQLRGPGIPIMDGMSISIASLKDMIAGTRSAALNSTGIAL